MTTRRRDPKQGPEDPDGGPPGRDEVEQAIQAVIAAVLPRGRPDRGLKGKTERNPGNRSTKRERPAPGHKPAQKQGD